MVHQTINSVSDSAWHSRVIFSNYLNGLFCRISIFMIKFHETRSLTDNQTIIKMKHTCIVVICFRVLWTMYRNLSQAIAPIQNDDMMIGKSCPALTNLHKRALIVLSPSGQWPSAAMYRVSGQVKLHKKKSETDKANMKAFLGSVQGSL